MSRNLIERVLHQLTMDRSAKQRFRSDASDYLARYPLTDAERRMLLDFDVAGLQALGVNPMLTMAYWQELSRSRDMRQYMAALRNVAEDETVFVAALRQ